MHQHREREFLTVSHPHKCFEQQLVCCYLGLCLVTIIYFHYKLLRTFYTENVFFLDFIIYVWTLEIQLIYIIYIYIYIYIIHNVLYV